MSITQWGKFFMIKVSGPPPQWRVITGAVYHHEVSGSISGILGMFLNGLALEMDPPVGWGR